jgi:hypothetical protein
MPLDLDGARDRKNVADAAEVRRVAQFAREREQRVAPVREGLIALGRDAASALRSAGVPTVTIRRRQWDQSVSRARLVREWTEAGWRLGSKGLSRYNFVSVDGILMDTEMDLYAAESPLEWIANDSELRVEQPAGRLVREWDTLTYEGGVERHNKKYLDEELADYVLSATDQFRKSGAPKSPNSVSAPTRRKGLWSRLLG